VSKRLGHASPNITLGIYSHALPADEAAAAKIWNDALSDVISQDQKSSESPVLISANPKAKKSA
jgi:hypothetical protein